jgi:pimeloyl-ACP methyl ester carboxylesterase
VTAAGGRRLQGYSHGGLDFEVDDLGPPGGEPVILLHGFPSDRRCWADVAACLAVAGYRVLAPDQRGYSPGARPRRRRDHRLDRLGGDVLALADEVAAERFHLAGHDWGAAVGWYLAGTRPDRVRTLTAVSVPHPAAMRAAALSGGQALRSWYMAAFQVPGVERVLGAGGGAGLGWGLRRSGLDPVTAQRYAARAAGGGLRGPLGWYRAIPWAAGRPLPPSPVPTTLVWGSRDRFSTRAAAEGCARWVEGPYRFVEVAGSHWLPEEQAATVAVAVADLVRAHPLARS